jgi:hypothetical protein
MTFTTLPPAAAAESLRGLCGGAVHLPGDPGYDAARTPWNVAVDLRPAAVAYPADTGEVSTLVRAAAAAGLRVAAQGTGHNAGPLDALDDVVLLRTSAMSGVSVDPAAGVARVRGGTLWQDAVEAADGAGCSVLHGSSPDVGVVGYSLGGGLGWYARRLGLQTNAITAAEVVLADGSVVRTDADHEPDLFWALRGGGGNFGVVTELEFRTFDFTTAYAGMLVWDWSRAEQVLPRWAEWAAAAPDEVTTSFRLLQLPPLPALPDFLRGRQLVAIDGAVLAGDERAIEILAPLRALRPEIDTFARVPSATLSRLHMDPEGPTPGVSSTALLDALPADAIDTLLGVAGPGSGSSLLVTELRQLGGAIGRPAAGAGALPCVEGQFLLFGCAIAATPQMAMAGRADADRLIAATAPWHGSRLYLNFVENSIDTTAGYDPVAYRRLQSVRAALDPAGVFYANHRLSQPAISGEVTA